MIQTNDSGAITVRLHLFNPRGRIDSWFNQQSIRSNTLGRKMRPRCRGAQRPSIVAGKSPLLMLAPTLCPRAQRTPACCLLRVCGVSVAYSFVSSLVCAPDTPHALQTAARPCRARFGWCPLCAPGITTALANPWLPIGRQGER